MVNTASYLAIEAERVFPQPLFEHCIWQKHIFEFFPIQHRFGLAEVPRIGHWRRYKPYDNCTIEQNRLARLQMSRVLLSVDIVNHKLERANLSPACVE